MHNLNTPRPVIAGRGTLQHPALTAEKLAAIRERADAQTDTQLRNDLFALIAAVEPHVT